MLKELIAAAHKVVVRDGIARLTLDLVAREACVGKDTVLYYFPTKNILIGVMFELHLDATDTDDELDAGAANNPDLQEAPRLRVRTLLTELDRDGLDPTTAQLIRLVLDGMKFHELMGVAPTQEMRNHILERLLEIVAPSSTLLSHSGDTPK